MQGLSKQKNKKIEYNFNGLLKEYGLDHPTKLRLVHLFMQHDYLRHLYMKYLRLRSH